MFKFNFHKKLDLNYYGYVFWLCAMSVALMSIATAMFVQYFLKELPCSLCLQQRVGFFGFIFGTMLYFKGTSRFRSIGVSLFFIVVLIIMSVRQSLLDIYPRPGHAWIGPSIFGLHLPVWTFVGCLMLILVIACNFIFVEREIKVGIHRYPALYRISHIIAGIAVVLCLINFISVIVQCGPYGCHTEGYYLLK